MSIFKTKRFWASILFIIFGVVFMLLPKNILYTFTLKFIGILLCLSAILKLMLVSKKHLSKKDYVLDIVEGFLVLVLSVVIFQFCKYRWVTFTCGLIYAVIPILRLILSKHLLNQLFVDSLKYVTIVILISSLNKYLMTRYIITSLFFIIAMLMLISLVVSLKKSMNESRVVEDEKEQE